MKQHFQTLDGLRGVAAFAVFAFHLLELMFLKQNWNPLPRAYLAVDFFFSLSGFVIGYAYDHRLALNSSSARGLSFNAFLARRLIRLQPMVVIGILLGAICYAINPFVADAQGLGVNVSYGLFATNLLLGLFLLPAPTLPNMWAYTHSLNGPVWSLLQEYLANLSYGLFGYRLRRYLLAVIAATAAAALLWMSLKHNTVTAGATWSDWWGGPIRLVSSFSIGLLIHRLKLKITLPAAFPLLSVGLIVLFVVPMASSWSGLFDWFCVVALFPLIIMFGAGSRQPSRIAETSGRLSYPLYMVHYPLVLLFAHWNWSISPSPVVMWAVFAATLVAGASLAWCILVWIDEPLRAWLSWRDGHRQAPKELHSEPNYAFAQHLDWCRHLIRVNETTIEQLKAQNAHLQSVIERFESGAAETTKKVQHLALVLNAQSFRYVAVNAPRVIFADAAPSRRLPQALLVTGVRLS